MNRFKQLAVGDWVRGKTQNGELIIGFVEATDAEKGSIHVYVVHCDHEKAVGKVAVVHDSWVEPMGDSEVASEEQVRDLIDLALATRDRAWFMELVAQEKSLPKSARRSDQRGGESRRIRNRLGTSAIWE